MHTSAGKPASSSSGVGDLCLAVGLKDVKIRGTSSLKVVGDEDSYAVSPRAPLLTTDLQNNAYLCGEARFGQLGSGVRPISHHRPVPTPQPQSVAGDNSWAFISLGSFHAAAITSQGKLYTWGLNSQGQCGVVEPDPADRGRVTYYPGPARVKSSTTGGTYKAVACGGEHTVALGSRGVCAWGNNKRGQLGLGMGAPQTVWRPLLLPSLARTSVTQLVCGAHHSLALTAQSQVLAWGSNERGQLGLGDTDDRPIPTPIEGLWGLPITRLAAGDTHSLALTTTGQLFTWGSNSHGQCGVVLETELEPPSPGPQDPAPLSPAHAAIEVPVPDVDPGLLQAWKGVMASMGIAPDLIDLCLAQTGYRGVEIAVEWLFSQDEGELSRHLELRNAALAPAARRPLLLPDATHGTNDLPLLEGHAPSGARDGMGTRSRLGRMARSAALGQDGGEVRPGSDEGMQQEALDNASAVLAPVEVALQGVRHMAAGMCFSVAVLEQGEVYSWGLGAWGALGHADTLDHDLPKRVELLEGAVVERVSCGQYHTTFIARDGTVYGCGRCEAGQLGHVIPQGLDAPQASHTDSLNSVGGGGGCIILRPLRLQLTSTLLEELSAVQGGGQGSPFQESSPAGHGSSNSCSDAMSDGDCGTDVVGGPGFQVRTTAGATRAAAGASMLVSGMSRLGREHRGSLDDDEDGQADPSPTKTILYEAPMRSPYMGPGVVLHEVVAGGCNTAILLRKQQENPSPWQVTLLAKLQAAVARALALQNGGTGPTAQLALALRNVARGASLVLSSPAALCAALAVRAPRTPLTPASNLIRTPTAALSGSGIFNSDLKMLGGSPRHRTPRSTNEGPAGTSGSLPKSIPVTPRSAAVGATALATPLPLPLDILLLDQLYCSLLELSGVGKEPAALGSLAADYDQGPAMCELQRYGLQQALLRCGLTLCEDLMVHATLLRAPDRAQVLLAALHSPLLSDPTCCKQLLPKLCHAVLAAPAAARRLLVRWWASYPPDLLLERLVQPMQAFITKELAAVKKLTSSIMAVIKVLARVEAANQLAGGRLPPECFYNTLISEKMDVQDHYSAWRTTQDLGGGLPGVRPVTNTSGAQYYACEPDSDRESTPLTSPTGGPPSRSRSGNALAPSSAVARTGSDGSSGSNNSSQQRLTPLALTPPAGNSATEQVSPLPGARAASRISEAGSETLVWDEPDSNGLNELPTQSSMRMSDPGRRTVALPPINISNPNSNHTGGAPACRRTLTGSTAELQQRRSHHPDVGLPPSVSSPSPTRGRQTAWGDNPAPTIVTLPPVPQPPCTAAPLSRPRPGLPPRSGSNAQPTTSAPQQPMFDLDDRSSQGQGGRGRSSNGASRLSEPGSPPPRPHAGAGRSSVLRNTDWQDLEPEPAAATPVAPPAPPAPRPVSEPGPFSFCTYPFLLDARAKSNLLHIEARFQMEQTVAHARMEQQLYGQHTRFVTRSESGSARARGRGEAGSSNSNHGGSSSYSGAAGAEEAIMFTVLDKVAAAEAEEEEEGLDKGSWGSTGVAGGSGGARLAGAGGAGGPPGLGRSSSGGSRSRTKGFRGLLAALLRHGVRGATGSSAAADAEEVAALMSDRRAESFKLPRPSECTMPGTHSDMCIIRVRRTHLVEDALDEITRQVRRDLFKPLRVHFIGEDGIDAGGVKKEFFALLLAELLKPEFGLMEIQPDTNTYWFPRHSLCHAHQYQLLGLVLGLAVYNRVLLDFPLPMVAYKKMLGVPVGLLELTEMCPPLGNSVKQLLELEGPPGTVEDLLCLTWAVEGEAWGVRTTTELVPGGEQIPVTEENRSAYADCLVSHYLYDSIKWQFEAFARGFGVMCNGPALRLFNSQELERLVCGNPMLDWGALQRNAKYEGGYTANSPVVVWLWDVVRNELPLDEKKRFLKFFTGSDRAPIGGLGTLRCLIQRAGPDSSRLPTSHTCFNTLLLPEYLTRVRLAKQLRLAINNAEGFGLE